MAFAQSGIVSIVIPDSVTEIGEEAFYECKKMTNISLSKRLTSIKKYTFYGCENLSKIIIPGSVKSIGEYAFYNCRNIKSLIIPGSVQTIENRAFLFCFNLCQVRLAYGVKTIGVYAFASCGREAGNFSIIVPDSVTSVQAGAFSVDAKILHLYYYGTQYQWSVIAHDEIEYSIVDDYIKHFEYRPLIITKQPKSVTVTAGNKVTVSVEATGKDVAYQWYYKKQGDAGWIPLSGKTGSSVSFTADMKWNGRQLYCLVSSPDGQYLKSNTAYLTVNTAVKIIPNLKITTQPVSKTVQLGNSMTLSLKAEGSGLTYQWYFKKTGQTAFSKWKGHTRATETVTPNATWNAIQLYCIVTDSLGKTVKSNTVSVKITLPLKITAHPKNTTVQLGKNGSISVKAEGTGLSYQWYYKVSDKKPWTKWSGRTHASESFKPDMTWNGRQFYCQIKDASGKTVKSNTIKLTVKKPALSITQQPKNKSVVKGTSITLSVKATGYGLKYQWYYKKKGAKSWTKWKNKTKASLSFKPDAKWNGAQFYCLVKDSSGKSVKSNPCKLTIKASPLIHPGKYRCYSYATGRGSFDYDDFKSGNTINLFVYSDNTATLYQNLYWDEGSYYDHSENITDLTFDNKAFYDSDGDVFCYYNFNENNMHLDLWYMDFDDYSFIIEEEYD